MPCSFCSSRYHDVRGCQDPTIGLLYERMKVIYVDMMNQYPHDTETRFKSVLNRTFHLRELRAVCASQTNFPSSRAKAEIIHSIYIYYSSRIRSIPRQEEVQPSTRLPTQADPIPDFARDLEQPPEEEHDIIGYIDTTPTPVSILRLVMIQEPPATQEHFNISELTGGVQIIIRDFVGINGINLMSLFDAVSGNIPFTPQVKKYNITPVLEVEEKSEEEKKVEVEEDCAICYESINYVDLVKLNCDHKFCVSCINCSLKAHNNMSCGPSCALCRKQMVTFSVKNPEIYNLVSEHCL